MDSAQYPFIFKIGGEAGFGIMSSGLAFSKFAMRSGYYVFDYSEYPSIIRGGHNVMQVTVSNKPIYSQYFNTHILVALNQETIDLHKHELTDSSIVIYDPKNKYQPVKPQSIPDYVKKVEVPFNDIATQVGKTVIMRNTVALGSVIALLKGDLNIMLQIITEEFAGKNQEIIELNKNCIRAGYDLVISNYSHLVKNIMPTLEPKGTVLLTGNESVSFASINAGMTFCAVYPMTPTSNILHILAPLQTQYNFLYKQPEDEISAINMAIGASHSGARTMVATSGGGFCLMAEGLGLAGITEIPVVIIEGMRGSPATGLPTWTEQGDLRFVLHAHQGDFFRIVLVPGDIEEIFYMTQKAFNLADKYQTPVVILIDKYLCESHATINFPKTDYIINRGSYINTKEFEYKRYSDSDTGISKRSPVGVGNFFVSNSDEHDEFGFSIEDAQNRKIQMNKRMKKHLTCELQDMEEPRLYGPENAEITIVSWGSNKGPIIEAIKDFGNVNFLHITWANPFPVKKVKRVLENSKYLLNIECNYSGQMCGLIAEKTGIRILDNLLKYDGRPFYPEEIKNKIKNILNK